MQSESLKVIFDTNVWISFLIGKRLSFMQNYIVNGRITLIVSEQLLDEITLITKREKLKKYFDEEKVRKLILLMQYFGKKIEVKPTHYICRDPKDNFLLDLIEYSEADYLITGDKDIIELSPFQSARIITPAEFEIIMQGTSST